MKDSQGSWLRNQILRMLVHKLMLRPTKKMFSKCSMKLEDQLIL